MGSEPRTSIDLDIEGWEFEEQIAYRKAVGVNPHYAWLKIAEALDSPDRTEWANVDPMYLVGFVWVTGRRDNPDLTLDDVISATDFVALMDAFIDWVSERLPDPPAAPNRAARRHPSKSTRSATTSPATATSSSSASPTAGRAPK